MEYVAKQGTTALGIIGTALGGMAVAGGSLLAANGGRAENGECSENTPVSRYELGLQQTIAEQGSHIRLLEADKYTDQKIVDVYNAINPQINAIKDELRKNDQLNIAHALRQVGGRFFFYFYIHRYAAKDVIGGDVEEVGDLAERISRYISFATFPSSVGAICDMQRVGHFILSDSPSLSQLL